MLVAISLVALPGAHALTPTKAATKRPRVIIRANIDRFYEPILFRRNAIKPRPEGMERIHQAALLMKAHSNLKLLEISGHADDSASAAENQRISEDRANAVRALLINWGVEPQRLRTRAAGAKEPMARPNTTDGRRLNRRVDLVIIELDAP